MFVSILLILLSIFYSFTIQNELTQASDVSLDDNNVNLVLDSLNYNDMPKNFRKSSNLINTQSNNKFKS